MKYLRFVLLSVFLVGCNTTKAIRTATPTMLSSTASPALELNIDDSFKYLGMTDIPNELSDDPHLQSFECFIYIDKRTKKYPEKMLIFTFADCDARYYWTGFELDQPLTWTKTYIADVFFDSVINFRHTVPRDFVTDHLVSKGYDLAPRMLSKYYIHNMRHGQICRISYWEAVDSHIYNRLAEWNEERFGGPHNGLSYHAHPPAKDLEIFLNNFNERADKAVNVSQSERNGYW